MTCLYYKWTNNIVWVKFQFYANCHRLHLDEMSCIVIFWLILFKDDKHSLSNWMYFSTIFLGQRVSGKYFVPKLHSITYKSEFINNNYFNSYVIANMPYQSLKWTFLNEVNKNVINLIQWLTKDMFPFLMYNIYVLCTLWLYTAEQFCSISLWIKFNYYEAEDFVWFQVLFHMVLQWHSTIKSPNIPFITMNQCTHLEHTIIPAQYLLYNI